MEWKEIEGFEGYYVSDKGDVYSSKSDRILKQEIRKDGYCQVDLWVNGKGCKQRVHRLVAKSFVPNESGFTEVNHIDGNKQNNSADNLEWCTSEHNIKHAKGIGLVRGASVMVGDTCFSSMADAARYLGVSIGVIQGAINGKRISCYVNGKPVYLHGQEPRADRPRKKRAKGEHSKPKHGRHVMVDGVEYVSIKDAARALDTEPKNVKRVANGDSVSGMIKGHKVWYSDSEWLQRDRSINHGGGKPSKKVRALSIDNDLMFSSVADAAKYFSVSRKTIRDYATNKREYNGYMFEIVE